MKITNIIAIIRREFLEHNGLFIRTPIILSLILIGISCVGVYKAASLKYGFDIPTSFHFSIGENEKTSSNKIKEKKKKKSNKHTVSDISAGFITANFILGMGLSFFYLAQCLYNDRKDKSILFWRSLPVMEIETIIAKLITGVWVLPFVFFVFSLAGISICLTILYISGNLFGIEAIIPSLNLERFSTKIMHLVSSALILMISLLPVYCWLLFSSAFAKRSPLLIAIGIPVSIMCIEALTLHSVNFITLIKTFFSQQMIHTKALNQLDFTGISWEHYVIAALLSAALLYLTLWLRNNRYEI